MRLSILLIGLLTGFSSLTRFSYAEQLRKKTTESGHPQKATPSNRYSGDYGRGTVTGSSDRKIALLRSGSFVGPTITVSGNTNSAIQAAIDAAPSSGATIVIPAGRYVFTGECSMANKSNLTFLGSGSGSTEFYVAPGVNISHMLNAVGTMNNIRLTGIAFNNQSSISGYGMIFSNEKAPINGYEIDHCSFTAPNLNCNAIKLNPQTYIYGVSVSVLVTNVYIHDNKFFSLGRMAIELQNHGWEKGEAPVYQIDGVRVEDNEFTDLGRVDGNNGMAFSVTGPNQNVFIRRNKVTDAKYAAYELVGSRDSEVSDNSARAVNNYYTGISVSDNGHRYTTRLKFLRNDIIVKSNAFQIYGGDGGSVTSWEASNNNFVSSTYSSGDQGSIKLQAASGGTFANNTVRTGGYNAVFLDNAPQNVFTGNNFSNEDNPANSELINFNNSGTYGNQLASSNTYRKQSGTVMANFAVERNGAHDNLFNITGSAILRSPDNPANAVNGLDYSYYEGSWTSLPDFTTLTPVKTGISSTPTLTVSNRDNNYALRYTGYISVPTDGQYTFYAASDDGSKVFIGSTQLLANDGVHAADQEQSGTIGLKAGLHALTIVYFQGGGGQALTVSYNGPGVGKQVIPAAAFFRVNTGSTTPPPTTTLRNPDNPANAVNGLDYSYYEGNWGNLPDFNTLSSVKTGISGTPTLSVTNRDNNYALRYTGYISVPTDGQYTFYTVSDDGSKLLIGSTEIAANDGVHGDQERSGTIGLKAGLHALTIVYFQGGGGQSLTVSYNGPGVGRQIIPAAAFFRVNTGSTTPPPTTTLRNPDNPANAVNGLDYGYYEGSWGNLPDFNALSPVKTGISSTPTLSVSNRDNNYALRYTGYISVPTDGQYTFYTVSDDGSKLLIGSTEIAANDGVHGDQERLGTIGLKAGLHALTIVYFQGGGGQSLTVSYSGPGVGRQVIPAAALFRVNTGTTTPPANNVGSGTGLRGEYYNNTQLTAPVVLTRNDAVIDFNWGDGSPAPGTVGVDNFSARWTGKVEAPVTGSYVFSTTGDDGVRLWVNGVQVINDWNVHAPTTNNSNGVMLTAGQRYDIRMEYFEYGGGASVKLMWTYPGQGQQVIPQTRLYPAAASPGRIAVSEDENAEVSTMRVYPVPARENLWIRYYAATAGEAVVQLISSASLPVVRQVQSVTAGENLIKVGVNQLNRGVYILSLTQGLHRQTRKIILVD